MKKKFDCVALQDEQAARIRKETAKMTRSEELEYWAEKGNSLRRKVCQKNTAPRALQRTKSRYVDGR